MEYDEGTGQGIAVPDYVPPDLLAEYQQYAFHQVRWSALAIQLAQRDRPPAPAPIQSRRRAGRAVVGNPVTLTGVTSTMLAIGIWGAATGNVPALALGVATTLIAAGWVTWVATRHPA